MSGGDVGPLGKDAVTELHGLFRWAAKSPRFVYYVLGVPPTGANVHPLSPSTSYVSLLLGRFPPGYSTAGGCPPPFPLYLVSLPGPLLTTLVRGSVHSFPACLCRIYYTVLVMCFPPCLVRGKRCSGQEEKHADMICGTQFGKLSPCQGMLFSDDLSYSFCIKVRPQTHQHQGGLPLAPLLRGSPLGAASRSGSKFFQHYLYFNTKKLFSDGLPPQ